MPSLQEASAELAAIVAGLELDAIPEVVRAGGRQVLLDAFACALAGSAFDAGALAPPAAARVLGERGRAVLLGSGARTTPAHAAFVNGTHVHALNFDANGPAGGHVGLVALAPVLAAAESRADPLPGRELLCAALIAGEVADRLAAAVRAGGSTIHGQRDGGWLLGQVIGYVAAACGAARALGLDAAATHAAIGLAVMQAAGTKQVMIEGDAPAKSLYGGFACLGGTLAAALADGGVDARVRALEGDAGLMAVFFDRAAASLEPVLDGLGVRWSIERPALKRWPASGVVQRYVDAARELSADGVEVANMVALTVVGDAGERDWFEPVAVRRRPENAAAAGNSVPFGVACGLVHGGLHVADLAAHGDMPLGGSEVAEVLSRTEHRFGEEPAVFALLADGRERRVACGPRHGASLSEGALRDKLAEANHHAQRPRSDAELASVISRLDDLEELADARGLFARDEAPARGGQRGAK